MTPHRPSRRSARLSRSSRNDRLARKHARRSGKRETLGNAESKVGLTAHQDYSIAALPPHKHPSRNGSSHHHATMPPSPREADTSPTLSVRFFRHLPALLMAAGAGSFGLITSTGHLLGGSSILPHRLRALLAALLVIVVWSLCAAAAPSLVNPRQTRRRVLRVILFLAGIVFLMAGLHTAKAALAYVNGGFTSLLCIIALIIADVQGILRHRPKQQIVAFFIWCSLLASLSIALLQGGWDMGSIILSTGYGALCAAVRLTEDQFGGDTRRVQTYSALLLAGNLCLPALAIISGLPLRYLMTYGTIVPSLLYSKQLRTSNTAPSSGISLALAGWFILAVVLVSMSTVSVQEQTPPSVPQKQQTI